MKNNEKHVFFLDIYSSTKPLDMLVMSADAFILKMRFISNPFRGFYDETTSIFQAKRAPPVLIKEPSLWHETHTRPHLCISSPNVDTLSLGDKHAQSRAFISGSAWEKTA